MLTWIKKLLSSGPRSDPAISRRAAIVSEIAIDGLEKFYGVTLDFSPESLKLVDDAVLRMSAEGTTEETAPTLIYATGCYVGEVLVKNLGAYWVSAPEEMQAVGISPEAVATRNGVIWNPIGKVKKLLSTGIEHSVHHFYQEVSANNSFKPKPLRGSA